MKFTQPLFVILGLTSLIGPSCSMSPNSKVAQGVPLTAGIRYEVRKAMSSRSTFDPTELKSMYFVLKPDAPPMVAGNRSAAGGSLAVRTTAYTHSEADHLIYGRMSAVGRPLQFGTVRSAAADWSRFPLGTRFQVKGQPGVVYQVDDYGSALVGSNTIDLYCPTHRQMVNWGVRTLDIEVIHWGSLAESMECMKDRVAFPHVRRMMREIEQQMASLANAPKDSPMRAALSAPPPPAASTAMLAPRMLRRDGWSWSDSSL